MKKLTFILALFLVMSCTAYGQEVIGDGTIAKEDRLLSQQLPQFNFSLKPFELKEPIFISRKYIPIDRIDPFMPIVVPHTDSISKFPIKAFPKNFHSNMPIAKLLDPIHPNLGAKRGEQ